MPRCTLENNLLLERKTFRQTASKNQLHRFGPGSIFHLEGLAKSCINISSRPHRSMSLDISASSNQPDETSLPAK